MTSDSVMRASDHDRERAAAVLCDAYAVGRLDVEEFHERAGGVYSARTWGELRDLTGDLPAEHVLPPEGHDAGSQTEITLLDHAPRRPFAPIWVTAVVWLAIAAAAYPPAAIPLVLLWLFVLRAACWTVRAGLPPCCPDMHVQHVQPAGRPARTGSRRAIHDWRAVEAVVDQFDEPAYRFRQ